jgi:hypothetical protein
MEVAVVVALLSMLFGLVWLNILGSKEHASQNATIDVLLSDIRAQQLRAMLGDTGGRVTSDSYGIRFNTTSYTLFHGPTFVPADPSNQTISLGDQEYFKSVSFPSNQVIFASISGQIVGFSQNASSFILSNASLSTQKNIQLNKLGSVYAIN